MSSKDEITYIFGAGASYYSMPLVKNFESRFRFFLSYLRGIVHTSGHKKFLKDSEEFIDQVKAHLSFDTFFKKLFHTRKDELILNYKAVLLTYFIFEHIIEVDTFNSLTKSDEKTHPIDPRYEALIAGLLKPVQGFSFGRKINFITWNYDLNLLLALRNFKEGGGSVYDFITNSVVERGFFQIGNEVNVYHINGYVYHRLLNNIGKANSILLPGIMMSIIEEYSIKGSEIFENAQKINFAWEILPKKEGQQLPDIINKAMHAIQNSESVVLIGYSLPAYNRIYDSTLINTKNLDGAIFCIQDVAANDVRQIIEGDLGVYSEKPYEGMVELKIQTNCNSFILV